MEASFVFVPATLREVDFSGLRGGREALRERSTSVQKSYDLFTDNQIMIRDIPAESSQVISEIESFSSRRFDPNELKLLLSRATAVGAKIESPLGSEISTIVQEYCTRKLLLLIDHQPIAGLKALVFSKHENSVACTLPQSQPLHTSYAPGKLIWVDLNYAELQKDMRIEEVLNLLTYVCASGGTKALPIELVSGAMRSAEADEISRGLSTNFYRIPTLEKLRVGEDSNVKRFEVRHIRTLLRPNLILTAHEGERQSLDYYWNIAAKGQPLQLVDEKGLLLATLKKGIERVMHLAHGLGAEFVEAANSFSESPATKLSEMQKQRKLISELHAKRSTLLQFLSEFQAESADLVAELALEKNELYATIKDVFDVYTESLEQILKAHVEHAKRAEDTIKQSEARLNTTFSRIEGRARKNFSETATMLGGLYVLGNVLVRAGHDWTAVAITTTVILFQAVRYGLHQKKIRTEEAKYWNS